MVPLLRALVSAHSAGGDANADEVNLIVFDHPELVSRLVTGLEFTPLFAYPGMTLDGEPVYPKRGGGVEELEYFGLIHPTFG